MPRRLPAFSLIELMVVVAIIGVLATIGIPSYRRMTCRANRTEGVTNTKTFALSAEAWAHENDTVMQSYNDFAVGRGCDGLQFSTTIGNGGWGTPPPSFPTAYLKGRINKSNTGSSHYIVGYYRSAPGKWAVLGWTYPCNYSTTLGNWVGYVAGTNPDSWLIRWPTYASAWPAGNRGGIVDLLNFCNQI